MNPADILQIAQQLRQSGMQVVEVRDTSTRLRIVARQGCTASVSPGIADSGEVPRVGAGDAADGETVVRSNALGVVHLRHPSQTGGITLAPGVHVKASAAAIYLESRSIIKVIESPVSGEVVQLLVNDGDKVDFGKPVFIVRAQP